VRSKRTLGIQHDGHRTVVDEFDLHVGAEHARFHAMTGRPQRARDVLVEVLGRRTARRTDERGTPAATRVAEQRELRDAPPTSASARFIAPPASSKMRKPPILCAMAAASDASSSTATPTSTSSPVSIAPTRARSIVTLARVTRCTTARIA
jgi:hypothetical protein